MNTLQTQTVSNSNKKPILRKVLIYLLIIGALLLVLVELIYLKYRYIPGHFLTLKNSGSTKALSNNLPDFDQAIANPFKKTFVGNQYSTLITYINLSSAENKDLNKKYEYASRAYLKGLEYYNSSKKPEFKKLLLDLRTYLMAYPQFNKTNLPLPK